MRRLFPALLAIAIVGVFAWTLVFLYDKSKAKPVVYKTTTAEVRDIVQKTVAAGAIVPRQEVAIKPRVSGIVQKLNVEAGQYIKTSDQIALIRIVPNVVSLNAAEGRLASAKISLHNAQREYERLKQLHAQQLLALGDLNKAEVDFQLSRQELGAAEDNLQLVRDGAIRGSGKVSNRVESTVDGMVIEVLVKEGASVIETNNFNEGTTIASVADMSDMLFKGRVDESEVGKLRENMPVSISIGAIDGKHFEGTLEYIAPKGIERDGTIEFEVRAALKLPSGTFIRANYSANADIILDRRTQALAIDERVLQFDGGKPYVEVETQPQMFARRFVTLGLSDGLHVEILDGLAKGQAVKVPDSAAAPGPTG
jgi:HlyD family secretion protein